MSKKIVDVEDLLIWAAGELARKGVGNVVTHPWFDSRRRDQELVGRWTQPAGYPRVSPTFAAGIGGGAGRGEPPHADALRIEKALRALRDARPDPGLTASDLCDGLGFAIDAEAALGRAIGQAAELAVVFGRLARRPPLHFGPLASSPKTTANGRPGVWRMATIDEPIWTGEEGVAATASRAVEIGAPPQRKGVYPAGAYCRLIWSPEPASVVAERAEYAAWRAALTWLAGELEGELESRFALAPRAALRPWAGEVDLAPVADPFRAGAERVYSGAEARAAAAERTQARRRTPIGGGVYHAPPIFGDEGEDEA